MTAPRFDPKITLGHILTAIGMAATSLIAWGVMSANVAHLSKSQDHSQARTERVEARTNSLEADSAATKQSIIGIEKGIQDLREDLRLQKGTAAR